MDVILTFILLLLLAVAIAVPLRKLGFAPIAGYIIAGLVIGPGLSLVDPNSDTVKLFSEIGIALISFQIGLTAKLGLLKRYGQNILLISGLELLFIMILSTLVGLSAGMRPLTIVVLFLIAVNTSTVMAFKFLEGKGILNQRSSIIIFIVATIEDFVVICGISLIPAFSQLGQFNFLEAMLSISEVVLMVLVMLVIGVLVLPKILNFVNKTKETEISIIITLAIALGYGWLGSILGVSFALGSFLAGLIVSSSTASEEITTNMKPLRDLFAIVFFTSIGMSTPKITDYASIITILLLALIIISIKFISSTSAAWFSGNTLREALKMGIFMIPISELAFIVAREAYNYGIVDQNIFTTAIFVVIISAFMASKLIEHDEKVATKLASIIPHEAQKKVENVTTWFIASFKKLFSMGRYREVLLAILKKTVAIMVIVMTGTLAIQLLYYLSIPQQLFEIIGALIITLMLALSLIEVAMATGDLERFSRMLASTYNEAARQKVGSLVKNIFYTLIISIISLVMLLNVTVLIRNVFKGYFQGATADLITFAVMICLLFLLIIPSYKKIRRILETLEQTIGSF